MNAGLMKRDAHAVRPLRVLLRACSGAALVLACSLQMPSEEEVFGGAGAPSGGGAGGKSGASGGTSGRSGAGGLSSGGSAGAAGSTAGRGGTSNAGSSGRGGESAGSSGRSGASGAAGTAGAAPNGGAAGDRSGGDAGMNGEGGTGATGSGSDGLIAHFAFDEESGTSVANGVDPRKPATCHGSCTWPDGRHGRAVSIRNSDSDDWIELPPGLLSGRSAVSISIWLRDLSTTRQGGRLFHFSAGTDEEIYFAPDDVDPDSSEPASHLGGTHDGSPFLDLWTTSPNLTDKEWHHVVVTWSSQRLELYLDGARRAELRSPSALPYDLGTTGPDYLGRTLNDGEIGLYVELDDLRIYSRALSSAEIAELFVAP